MRRFSALALSALLLLGLTVPAQANAPSLGLTVLFTHDTHDHFYPDAGDIGGYTRLATLLEEQRRTPADVGDGSAFSYPTVTLDAGDFSMGSLFQTVYATDAPELRALGAMDYDAVTLGNHEFDYRPQGLADMLTAAEERGEALPAIVQANYKTPKDPADPASQALVKAMEDYPVTDYTVIEREGLTIAVFGVMGVDSDECAPMSGMTLEPLAEAAGRVVAEIREKEGADFIICLSHSGTEEGKGEDYELARAVEGIDLIISGHTHTTLSEPIQVNNTLIVSCGPYTQNLGRITIHKKVSPDHELSYSEYQLLPIDGSVAPDPDMEALAQSFKAKVDENYLSQFGLGYDQVIARSDRDFTIAETGDLIGGAYIETVKGIEGEDYVPVAFAVAPDGVIRDRLRAGDITTAQAFDILSLGSGADGSPGYPLVSVYLTGKDLKNAFEVDASVSALMPAAELFGAGAWWEYNPHRMFLDRVTKCGLGVGAERTEIRDDQLYRVVADLYSGQMLSTVKDKSFGLLSITPRDEQGNEVTDFETRIIHDGNGREVKAWYALASYLEETGTVKLPNGSKAVKSSWNPVGLLIPMGAPTAVVLLAAALVIALAVLLIRCVRSRRKKVQKRPGGRENKGKA